MKKTFLLSFCLCIFLGSAFALDAGISEDEPYAPNIRDYRILQNIEQRITTLGQQGDKEKIVTIIGLSKVYLGKLKDSKSQYILFEIGRIAEEHFAVATQQQDESTQPASSTTTGEQITGSSLSTATYTYIESGKASYYASSLEGNHTANGDVFDNTKLTAAHKTLPFNSRVKITNTQNNTRVIVRINDRGPFTPGRVIDLSQAAFKALNNDSLSAGILEVTLEKEE